MPLEPSKQRRGLVAIDGAMALIVILLVVQIWLLSATLETFLAGHSWSSYPRCYFLRTDFLGMPGFGPLRDASRSRVAEALTSETTRASSTTGAGAIAGFTVRAPRG